MALEKMCKTNKCPVCSVNKTLSREVNQHVKVFPLYKGHNTICHLRCWCYGIAAKLRGFNVFNYNMNVGPIVISRTSVYYWPFQCVIADGFPLFFVLLSFLALCLLYCVLHVYNEKVQVGSDQEKAQSE